MLRGPPVPITGLAPATSGVAVTSPNVSGKPRSLVNRIAGLAQFGWLRTLKNSARNCTPTRSLALNVLTSEKSQLWRPGPRQLLRPAGPKLAASGGCITRPYGIGPVVEKLGIVVGSSIRFHRSLNSPVPLESFSKSMALYG